MDPLLEDFISYECQYEPRNEGLFDTNFALTSPFSDISNNQQTFLNFIPDMPSSLVSPFESQQKEFSAHESEVTVQTQQPADKKKQKKGKSNKEELDLSKLYIPPALQAEIGSKLNIQSKKISKAEKSASPENLSEGSKGSDLASKEQKKNDQVIRNRMSAQISRDKKKVYLQQLEEENQYLKQERVFMVEKIQRLETGYMQVLKENEILKSNGALICQNCGSTGEFRNNSENAVPVRPDESVISSPVIVRDGNKKGFFGFSYSFTTLLCLVFVMTGGTDLQSGESSAMINLANTVRSLTNEDKTELTASVPEAPVMPSASGSMGLNKSFEPHFSSFDLDTWPIMEKIESKIEEFDAYHEKLFDSHREHNNSVIDLSISYKNITDSSSASANSSNNTSEKSFLSKPAVKARNKTSTMYCPSGVEFFQSSVANSFEDERDHGFALFGSKSRNMNRNSKVLNLDKAEYIQLLIPRYSIGRLGVSGNSSEFDQTPIFGAEDENGLVEVWCKIFAINGLSRAL